MVHEPCLFASSGVVTAMVQPRQTAPCPPSNVRRGPRSSSGPRWLLLVCVALLLLPFASAHGVDKPDEDEEGEEQAGMDDDHAETLDGLDHTTVMAIAYAASSLTFLFVWLKWSDANMVFPPHVIGFAKYSGMVHLLLGLQDPLLLLGGLGVFGLLAAPVVIEFEGSRATLARAGRPCFLPACSWRISLQPRRLLPSGHHWSHDEGRRSWGNRVPSHAAKDEDLV